MEKEGVVNLQRVGQEPEEAATRDDLEPKHGMESPGVDAEAEAGKQMQVLAAAQVDGGDPSKMPGPMPPAGMQGFGVQVIDQGKEYARGGFQVADSVSEDAANHKENSNIVSKEGKDQHITSLLSGPSPFLDGAQRAHSIKTTDANPAPVEYEK